MLNTQNPGFTLQKQRLEEKLKNLTFVEVNEAHLLHNLRILKKMSSSSFFCAMVKGYGYGHGLLEVAHPLVEEGVSALGVSSLEEALILRNHHIHKTPILLFNSLLTTPIDLLEKFHITPVVGSFYELECLQKNLSQKHFSVHINMNTGMQRLEFSAKEKTLNKIKTFFQKPSCKLHFEGFSTHSCYAEDLGTKRGQTLGQLETFLEVKDFFQKDLKVHALRTASLLGLHFLKKHHLLRSLGVRIGGGLYGIGSASFFKNPSLSQSIKNLSLKPVLTLKSHVILYHKVPCGKTLSYSHSWKAKRDSLVGVVPFGYAHGFLRPFSQKLSYEAVFKGKRVKLIGNVNMDFSFFDFTDIGEEHCKVGEEILLLGTHLPVEEVAEKLGTIPYDILVQIQQTVPRRTIL